MRQVVKNRILVVGNLIFFIIMLVVNGLANTIKIGGKMTGEISDSIPNLFVPAGFTFAIWAVIYLLLFLFTLNQWRAIFYNNEKLNENIERINIFYILSSVFNTLWIFAWHYQYFLASLIIMIALFFMLVILYQRLGIGSVKRNMLDKILLEVPISVYLGWITVALIANLTFVLKVTGWDRLGLAEELWAVVAIALATVVALFSIIFRRDLAFALVIIWAFIGIWAKRTQADTVFVAGVVYSVVIGLVLIACTILIFLILYFKKFLKRKS